MGDTGVCFISKHASVALVALLVCAFLCECASAASTSVKRPLEAPAVNPPAKKSNSKMSVVNEAFVNAGQVAGTEVWRIEDFKAVAYPKAQYGKFYTGDSYVILHTKIGKDKRKTYDIHFWLGTETSQDEAGAAAITAFQLDDQLGGSPVQHREVQDHESELFLSYFKNGVRYLPGGVNSGFTHVDPNAYDKKLFQVKGSRNIRVKEVTPTIASMNKGDCFILDLKKDIYVYVGAKSRRVERLKAIAAANQIRDQDHAGKSKVTIVDEFSSPSEVEEFFNALGGGSSAAVPDESVGGDDQQFETQQEKIVTLYRVSDASGSLQITPIGQKPFLQSLLDTNDCFILDSTDSNIFVWVGKKCTDKEKRESMKKAESYLTSKNYPKWTQIQRVVEGAEPTAFTQYFKTWKAAGELHARLVRSASVDSNPAWDPRLFHAQIRTKGGKFVTEQIHDFTQEDLNEDDVMLLDIGKELFVWIGNKASADEKRESQSLAENYLSQFGREDVTITTINQSDEPEQFKSQFPSWA